jgi:hypothetical protein
MRESHCVGCGEKLPVRDGRGRPRKWCGVHGYCAQRVAEHKAWRNIKQRIFNPRHYAYGNYGGRGLTMEPEWVHDFAAFLAEVGPKPSPELSIDRIDNDLGYVKGNLRWATLSQQNANKRYGRAA